MVATTNRPPDVVFKDLVSRTTALDAKLFAIRLEVFKITSINIKHIILITGSLSSARKVVDSSVYSGQAHSLANCSTLRLFFCSSLSYKIEFWDCLSKYK